MQAIPSHALGDPRLDSSPRESESISPRICAKPGNVIAPRSSSGSVVCPQARLCPIFQQTSSDRSPGGPLDPCCGQIAGTERKSVARGGPLRRRIRSVAPTNGVELVSLYSKNSNRGESSRIEQLLSEQPSQSGVEASITHLHRDSRRRLGKKKLAELVASFEAGVSSRALAEQYSLERHTVYRLLADHGFVLKIEHEITPEEQLRAVGLYVDHGYSIARVAAELGIGLSPARRALRNGGVTLRGRHQRG